MRIDKSKKPSITKKLPGRVKSAKASKKPPNTKDLARPFESEKIPDKTKPNWEIWNQHPFLQLWEAIALSKNMNPSSLAELKKHKDKRCAGYFTRLRIARSNLGGKLDYYPTHPVAGEGRDGVPVKLVDFVCFVKEQRWPVPQEFAALNPGATGEMADAAPSHTAAQKSDSSNKQPEGAKNSKASQNANKDLDQRRENTYLGLIQELFRILDKGFDFAQPHKGASQIKTFLATNGSSLKVSEQTLADIIQKLNWLSPNL